jgi:ribosomal protein S18 acetylase RimI-like enzyme
MVPDDSQALNRHESLRFRVALQSDAEALARLINAAFVVERLIFGGDRTSPDGVRAYMEKGKFLLAEDSNGIAGCVYVELLGDRGYIGLLSVEPQRQGSGLGRKLMAAAEKFFREGGCAAVDLRVVSARTPLPVFYRRLGYIETHAAPIPLETKPNIPCHFIYMSKRLA